jgi:hypothetical protein
MQQTHRESHVECQRFPLAPTQIQCDIAAMSFSIPSGLDEILEILFVHSPIICVCLVAIILILARGRQLPWTVLCGFILLFIGTILKLILDSFLLQKMVDYYTDTQELLMRLQIYYFSISLIHALAFGCLLHAFLRMAKRRKADFPEASGE